jgi:hypothetical protein
MFVSRRVLDSAFVCSGHAKAGAYAADALNIRA